jgi:hypothetical protein
MRALTVTTESLQTYYKNQTHLPVRVLPEVLPIKEVRQFQPRSLKKIGWFGLWHTQAPGFLRIALEGLEDDYEFHMMSHESGKYRKFWHDELVTKLKIKTTYHGWSWDDFSDFVQSCDLIVIPTIQNQWWKGKSQNRFVLAVSNGTPVLCSPTLSYLPLTPYTVDDVEKFPEAIRLMGSAGKRKELWDYQVEKIQPLLPDNAVKVWEKYAEEVLLT